MARRASSSNVLHFVRARNPRALQLAHLAFQTKHGVQVDVIAIERDEDFWYAFFNFPMTFKGQTDLVTEEGQDDGTTGN